MIKPKSKTKKKKEKKKRKKKKKKKKESSSESSSSSENEEEEREQRVRKVVCSFLFLFDRILLISVPGIVFYLFFPPKFIEASPSILMISSYIEIYPETSVMCHTLLLFSVER